MSLTSEEIKIMAAGGRCCITNDAGKYLAYGKDGKIAFVDDKSKAFIYDFIRDNVPIQIEQISQAYKVEWHAIAA
jgi:hypothetical protein